MKESTKNKIVNFTTRLSQGFLMGAFAGLSVGFVIGTLSCLTMGPKQGSWTRTIGKQMLMTSGWLGLVLGVGSCIRGDEEVQTMEYKRIPCFIK
jgi:hypothetical protein